MKLIIEKREFMKANFAELENIKTDQNLNKPAPTLEKYHRKTDIMVDLVMPENLEIPAIDLFDALKNRKSVRKYSETSLMLDELSFLLWATQGINKTIYQHEIPYCTMRTVPSAGARHPFETYLIVHNVENLAAGIYRYIASEHKLCFLYQEDNLKEKINEATLGQKFTMNCAVVFVWSCIPYRAEWRYSVTAHKTMLLDAGHVCQNLYLACEAIKSGTCAIAAYDQEKMDKLINVDGKDEYTIYIASVGKV